MTKPPYNLLENHPLIKEKKVNILFKTVVGSRAYGTQRSDSDWDIRFVYTYKPEDYITVKPLQDNIQYGEDDIVGMELGKFFNILLKSGSNALEMIHSPYFEYYGNDKEEFINTCMSYYNPFITAKSLAGQHKQATMKLESSLMANDPKKTLKYVIVRTRLLVTMYYMLTNSNNKFPPIELNKLLKEMGEDKTSEDVKALVNQATSDIAEEESKNIMDYYWSQLEQMKQESNVLIQTTINICSKVGTKPNHIIAPLNKLYKKLVYELEEKNGNRSN